MSPNKCKHEQIQLDTSPHALTIPFQRPPHPKRLAAATPSGRVPQSLHPSEQTLAQTFPGPLVLPDDALTLDPKEPPQSLRSWIRSDQRNPLTPDRQTIYVAPFPTISSSLSHLEEQTVPTTTTATTTADRLLKPPQTEDVISYLKAFYHPLPVHPLPTTPSFEPWNKSSKSKSKYIGLKIGNNTVTRIRTRPCPDQVFQGGQLNLDDILDAALEALPGDAYALVMLVGQDLYEDEEDVFCCGRAYGQSRVAVVSCARYCPLLDGDGGGISLNSSEHGWWPAAHCKAFVDSVCGDPGEGGVDREVAKGWPVGAAVDAVVGFEEEEEDMEGVWFARLARTVSHELGHCLCLDHCVYYACVMQSTAGVAEDLRQPPYLCPLGRGDAEVVVRERYLALRRFWYYAWLGRRLEVMDRE
ncbi:hypothetical protein QBC47DRAFT_435896 [Echria macrotheca]|uniref:Uncharacterized protein n=1 Tax=Echria macrotheca TaxID=438768 RepID=A0AAJ0BIV1_9PEZI|nr:hypothetical protein QBC47DRAFT_435896 [Echria macrotheca]